MELEKALRISEKMRQFIEVSRTKVTFIDPEISTCPLSDLIEADKQACTYNKKYKCEKYMVVGDVFLSALYLCIHSIPQYFDVLDPLITVDNKTIFFFVRDKKMREEFH